MAMIHGNDDFPEPVILPYLPGDQPLGTQQSKHYIPRDTIPTEHLSKVEKPIVAYDFLFTHHRPDVKEMIAGARLQPHETVLDIGCGLGWATKLAAQQCRFAVGVDCDKKRISAATNQNQAPNCQYFAVNKLPDTKMFSAIAKKTAEIFEPTSSAPHQFDVVLLCWVMQVLPVDSQKILFEMLKESVLKPGGRVVLDYWAPLQLIRTIEVVWGVEQNGRVEEWNSWRKERVGNVNGVLDAHNALVQVAESSGWSVRSHQPFPTAGEYTSVTRDISDAARESNPGTTPLTIRMLERARVERMAKLEHAFRSSDTFPKGSGRVHYFARHKVAAVMAVLVPRS